MEPEEIADLVRSLPPGELAELVASLMEEWSSVDLDTFKRHLGHALYPLNPTP